MVSVWVLVDVCGCWSMYVGVGRCMWVLVDVCGCWSMYVGVGRCMWVLVGVCGCWSVYVGVGRCMWVLVDVCGCWSMYVGVCKHDIIVMWNVSSVSTAPFHLVSRVLPLLTGCWRCHSDSVVEMSLDINDDDDVARERQRVLEGDTTRDVLVTRDISKSYFGHVRPILRCMVNCR